MTGELDRAYQQFVALKRRQQRQMAMVILSLMGPLAVAVLYGLLKLAGWAPW